MGSRTNEKPSAPLARQGHGLLTTALVALLVSLGTTIGVVAWYDQRYAQKIVTMDLPGFIRAQRDRVVSGEITDDEFRRNLDAMEAALLAEPAYHVVLLKEVVVRNAPEIKP